MIARLLPFALLLVPVAALGQAPSDGDALAEQVRRLGSNPQDLDALLTAGELSVRMEDFSAAGAFFARAEKVDARNARAKAGEGAILVHAERPVEALRYFAMAEQLGMTSARFAGERGLAYDLIGDPGRAQRDYQAALAAGGEAEVRRRYALSLAIAGRQVQALAELDPLIRQNDRAAWRSRAFVLAMGGDAAGATRIAETMMPPGSATALQGFFAQLPRLSSVDKAFAVHFGEVQATPQRLADARLPHEAPLPVVAAPAVAIQIPAVGPVGDKRNRRDRRDRNRRNEIQVAAVALPPPPLPPAYEAPVYAPPAAATPMRDRPLTAGEQGALAAGGNRTTPVRGRRGQGYTAPVVTRALTPDEERSLAAVAGSRDGTTSHRRDDPPVQSIKAATEVRVLPPAELARAVPPAVPSLSSGPAASVVTRPLTAAEQASLAAAASPPPVPTPTMIPAPGPATALTAPPLPSAAVRPGFSTAAVEVASVATRPAAPSTPVRPRVSRRQQFAQADTVLSRIVAGLTVPAAELDVGLPEPTAADRRAAARRTAAAAKAAADRKAAAEAKLAADREAAEERRAARTEPARIWVQVAGGANEAGLALAWRTMQDRAPQVLTGRRAWTTPLRSTNRVLTGPFRTDAEARAVVNQLGKSGVQAFTFTSEAGQKVTRLPTQ